jgi:hypothetical protein
MDASLWVALLDLLWLILLAFAWLKDKRNHIRIHEAQHKWLDSLSERLRDIEGRMKSVDAWEDAMTGVQTGCNSEMGKLRALVDAHIRKDDAGAMTIGIALAERIDAMSARMDAVELACGLREKAKTMGGQDG